ncbi:MAG: response regulator [Armatimonadota bacterium]
MEVSAVMEVLGWATSKLGASEASWRGRLKMENGMEGIEGPRDDEARSAGENQQDVIRVLVVDDDPVVVSVTADVVRALGYEADVASNGAEALIKMSQKEYHAIICDLRMPVIDGEALYQLLRQQKPEVAKRVIFSTGDTGAMSSMQILSRLGAPVISKPFNMDQLDAVIRSVIEKPEEP